jgi:NitT/TauT family transport system substrate-binding protein
VEEWKTLDDLRGLVLAGKGDVWVGHLEAFGRAAAKGAKVELLAVTAWKKFWFLSAPWPGEEGGAGQAYPADPAGLARLLAARGLPLYAAPQSGPATGVLARIASLGGPSFRVESLPLQQVLLELASGRARAALIPEPGVSAALARNPGLRIAGSLEEEHARIAGGPARLPQAGVAADADFARGNPALVEELLALMASGAEACAGLGPEEAARRLPPTLRRNMGDAVLAASLARDPVLSVRASEAEEEIRGFLCVAAPELCEDGSLPAGFPAGFIRGGGGPRAR